MNAIRPLRLALVGNPNCGKTALFNRLTGARQKVANYAGVTVERKEGQFFSATGRAYQVTDLPGAYSLKPMTPDEAITREVLLGARADEAAPDLVVLVVDATRLRLNLRLVLEVLRLKRPTVLAVNMMDVARKRGMQIDIAALQRELGIPVIETVAVQPGGASALLSQLDQIAADHAGLPSPQASARGADSDAATVEDTQARVRRILEAAIANPGRENVPGERIDAVVLHPVAGYVILAAVLFLIFQAVFSWSQWPMELIKDGVDGLGALVRNAIDRKSVV